MNLNLKRRSKIVELIICNNMENRGVRSHYFNEDLDKVLFLRINFIFGDIFLIKLIYSSKKI